MNWTQEQIDALETAIKSGVTEYSYNGRVTKYRSLAEMKSILKDAKASQLSPSAKASRRVYAPRFDKGYQ